MKKSKTINKDSHKVTNVTLSVGVEMREKFTQRLIEINNKPYGNKISSREYIEFLMSLETEDTLKKLRMSTIKGKDINKLYMKRYFELNQNKSENDYYNFIWSDKALKFKKENKDILEIYN